MLGIFKKSNGVSDSEKLAIEAGMATNDFINSRRKRKQVKDMILSLYPQKSLTFDDVGIVPRYLNDFKSRDDTNTTEEFVDVRREKHVIFPAFGASMSFMRTKFAEAIYNSDGIHVLPRVELTKEERLKDAAKLFEKGVVFGAAIGANDEEEFILKLINSGARFISIDIAHGASTHAIETLQKLRNISVDSGVIVGNVGSDAGAYFLLYSAWKLGFKNIIIKVGVGPGAACTTRVNTGVGIGQMTALALARYVADEFSTAFNSVKIIADGGVEKPADFVKALLLANGVMMGKFFASGDFEISKLGVVVKDGKHYLRYYGMASKKAKGGEGVADYVEGTEVLVPLKWSNTDEAIKSLKNGLASAMSYVGAKDLNTFRSLAEISFNTYATVVEANPRGE